MVLDGMEEYSIDLLDPSRSDDFFRLIDGNRDRLLDFFSGTVARTGTLEDTREYCKFVGERMAENLYYPFMICVRKTGEYIGLIDVKRIEWTVPKAELGYFIDGGHEGRGIVSRALEHVVRTLNAEHSFRKLLCRVNSGNTASISVAKKNGFEFEGTIRNDYVTSSGELVDLDYYGRVFEFSSE